MEEKMVFGIKTTPRLFCFGFSKRHQLLYSYLSNRNRQTQVGFNWQPKLCIVLAYLSSSARGMKIEAIQFIRIEFCMTAFQGSNAEILSRETFIPQAFWSCSGQTLPSEGMQAPGGGEGKEHLTWTYSNSFGRTPRDWARK